MQSLKNSKHPKWSEDAYSLEPFFRMFFTLSCVSSHNWSNASLYTIVSAYKHHANQQALANAETDKNGRYKKVIFPYLK